MSQAPVRATGLPATTRNPYADDTSFVQGVTQTAGPRTDVASSTVTERANQAVSSVQNAINTTPQVIEALNSLIDELRGKPAKAAVTKQQAELSVPMLVRETSGGFGPTQFSPGAKALVFYRDPRSGQTYSEKQGEAENARRAIEQREMVSSGAAQAATPAGTAEQRKQLEQRQEEIVRNRAAQIAIQGATEGQTGAYSKEAAFGDAQALVNKSITDALEKALPGITMASEGAGTSKGSMRALLTQRAAEKGAVEGAALGVQAATAYGGIANQAAATGLQAQNQLASVLELFTRSDPNSPVNVLLQALIGSKGLVESRSGSQVSDTSSGKTQDTVTNVGAQDTTVNTLKQILAPLVGANSRGGGGGGVPSAGQVRGEATSIGGPSPMFVTRNPASTLDESYQTIATPTEDAIYRTVGAEEP